MSIEFTIDSLDSVEESLRSAYVEKEGKYTLDPDKYAEYKASGLKAKNRELLDKLAKSKDLVTRFEKFKDLDPADLEQLLERKTGGEDAPPGKESGKGDDATLRAFEKQIAKLKAQMATETQQAQTEREKLATELQHYKLTVPLREIALKAGVLPEDLDLAMLETARRFRLTEAGKIEVLDEDGDPTTDTPEKFFKDIYRSQRPKFYAASQAGGSGAGPNTKAGSPGEKTITRAAFDKLSPDEAMKQVKAGVTIVD